MSFSNDYLMRQIETMSYALATHFLKGKSNFVYEIVFPQEDLSGEEYLKYMLETLLSQGRINEAENLLFACLEENVTPALVKMGFQFYEKLNVQSEKELQEKYFSKKEIQEGLKDLLKYNNELTKGRIHMKYLLGTDIGTSGTKTILMDLSGKLIAQDLQEYDVLTPKPLWAEQWPDVWYDATIRSIQNTVKKAGLPKEDIAGIAISGLYGGSGIPLDENMQPVRPCMIWMDRRADKEAQWALDTIGEEKLLEITHNGSDPYYGFTKMLWMKNNEPENWNKTKLFLPPNDYVIYKMTGNIAIDYSSAGNIGGIFDMNTRTWSTELMDAMGIPVSMMPEKIVESTDIVGGLKAEIAEELGLSEGMPVIASGIDCGAANIGLGVFESGIYAAAIGTSMCAALISDKPVKGDGLIVWPYLYDAKNLSYYFAGGATAGAIIKWFRNTLCQYELEAEKSGGPNAYSVLEEQAAQIPAGSEGLVVLPYFMGERSPVWDSDAKGTIVGLSLTHTKAHMYRAFLEAVAYSLRDAMEATGDDLGKYILIAGGVTKSTLWRHIFADVTGYPVVCPIHDVEANMGDVMLAGIGTELLTFDEVKKWQVVDKPIEVNQENHDKYNEYYKLYKSIYHNLKSDMKKLTEIEKK